MKRLFALCSLIFPLMIVAQLNQVVHELYATLDSGEEVYRIYAELANGDDFVSSVFAANNDPLSIGSTGGIINNEYGAITGDLINPTFCEFFGWEFCPDSYVTIGYAGPFYFDDTTELTGGQPITSISTDPGAESFATSFGTADGPNLELIEGSWFSPNMPGENAQGLPFGPNLRVLLAQVVVPLDETLSYNLNLQIFPSSVGANAIEYVGADGEADFGQIDGSELGLTYPVDTVVEGCLDPAACNIDPLAEIHDPTLCLYYDACGECGGNGIAGCMDYSACNFSSIATCDIGTCVFANECAPCGEFIPFGCMDPAACNYVEASICDDGSCFYVEPCPNCPPGSYYGCTDPTACNYWALANCDNGSCYFEPCFNGPDGDLNGFVNTEDLLLFIANVGCDVPLCFGDLNSDQIVNVLDLLIFLPLFNSTYP